MGDELAPAEKRLQVEARDADGRADHKNELELDLEHDAQNSYPLALEVIKSEQMSVYLKRLMADLNLGPPSSKTSSDVNLCKDHCDKMEVPDPLAVEDLISSKLNDK